MGTTDTPEAAPIRDCTCDRCTREAVKANPKTDGPFCFDARIIRMFLCETCGNKRCPHAGDHRFACTGSNEPGQTAIPASGDGYATAFYEIAEMLGIGARAASPTAVWRDEMQPKLEALFARPDAGEQFAKSTKIPANGYDLAFAGHDRMDRPTMDEVWRKGGGGHEVVANRTTVMRFIRTIDALESALAAMRMGEGHGVVISDVSAERERQKSALGWTPKHYDTNDSDQALPRAAACYALADSGRGNAGPFWISQFRTPHQVWPYRWEWKPKDRRTNLVRAAALLVAEIERLDRAAALSCEEG
ncbi:hypothetical protein [Sphingomonas sp. UYP23]